VFDKTLKTTVFRPNRENVLEQKSYVFSLQNFSLRTHFSIGSTVFDRTLKNNF